MSDKVEKKLIEFRKRIQVLPKDDKHKENRKKISREIFDYLDMNRSGAIERCEIKKTFEHLVRIHVEYVVGDYEEVLELAEAAKEERDLTVEEKTDELLKIVDTNSDGKHLNKEFKVTSVIFSRRF